MLGICTYIGASLMTLMAAWRLPALRYDEPQRRALWACAAGFAAALWCRVPAVKRVLDAPITDLYVLVKYLTSIVAILAVLRYITAIYGKSPGAAATPRYVRTSRRINNIAHGCALGAVGAMVVLFFTAVDRSRPSVEFATDHAGQWGAATFISILYVYLASATATCAFQWGRAAPRAETRLLRAGLTLMAVASVLYAMYSLFRIVTVWAPTSAAAPTMRVVADTSNLTIALLWAVGASIPSAKALSARWTTWRTLHKLYPLRRDLMEAFPDLTFQPPASRLREWARTSPSLDIRLDRWTQEIADAVELLRHHATPALLHTAEGMTAEHPDPDPAAEAYWIRAALHNAHAGARSRLPVRGLRDKPLSDSHAEAHWLARVQAVYATISNEQLESLLAKTGGRTAYSLSSEAAS
ncbi:MAB_1171c family putative transporter [Streptomyces sp. IBSNAI001]|uniref:MAB_1171c family putative transporter n=1 Tax=Streptomyces sp. IBSNAI001 TaxID=3457499 RepID=UPI003FD61BE8